MASVLVYTAKKNEPKTSRIMQPVADGLARRGHSITWGESSDYPQGADKADWLAIWGDWFGCERILPDIGKKHWNLIHIDNGYIGRGHYAGYYSLSYNDRQASTYLWDGKPPKPDRWLALNETIAPWRTDGEKILILGLSRKQCTVMGLPYPQFNQEMIDKVRAASGRAIELREKRYDRLHEPLRDVLRKQKWFAVVGYNTKGLVEALLEGIPIVALKSCVCSGMARTSTDQVLNRFYPDNRKEFFIRLAYHQWTRDEMRQGLPWQGHSPLSRHRRAA